MDRVECGSDVTRFAVQPDSVVHTAELAAIPHHRSPSSGSRGPGRVGAIEPIEPKRHDWRPSLAVRNDHAAQRGDTASGQTDSNRRFDAAPGAQMILSFRRAVKR
jgi:hypothetical protein